MSRSRRVVAAETTRANVADGTVGEAVVAKLRRLRDHHGYFTRTELGEAAPHRDPGEDWGGYDVVVLGLAPHPRGACTACRAVGA